MKYTRKDFAIGLECLGFKALGGLLAIIIGSMVGYNVAALGCFITAVIVCLVLLIYNKAEKRRHEHKTQNEGNGEAEGAGRE